MQDHPLARGTESRWQPEATITSAVSRCSSRKILENEIVKGPFPHLIHQHRFEARGEAKCVMRDTIAYQWGLSWRGPLVSETDARNHLTLLFNSRHQRTRRRALAANQR